MSNQPPPVYQPPTPFSASLSGWTSGGPEDWPNIITVRVITAWQARDTDPTDAEIADSERYADAAGEQHLLQIDTNYKDTRPGEHPVRLTRTDAIRLAAHILTATEDTFHFTRAGALRASEATDVLLALEQVDIALAELRSHALGDLLRDTGLKAN
jgi:hypothetical protein